MARRVGRRLGRRGAALLTLGITWVLVAAYVYLGPLPNVDNSFLAALPRWLRVIPWAVPGLLAVVSAFRQRDAWAWLGLYVAPALRIISYGGATAWSLIFGGTPDEVLRAAYAAVIHVPSIALVLICSGWREPAGEVQRVVA